MTHQPDFVAVRPTDAAVYGPRDAYVLAHVRYRCQQVKPSDDGCRYWSASYETIAAEIQLSRDAVKRALLSLRASGAVLAKRFGRAGDQKWGYSADQPSGDIALVQNAADQPSGDIALPPGDSALPPGRYRPETRAISPDVLLSQKERKEREGADAPTSPPQLTVISNSKPQTDGLQLRPPPRCDRHPEGTTAPCRQCQTVREWQEAAATEDAEARARLNRHVLAAIAACGECDHWGFVDDGDGDSMRRCTLHPNRDGMVS